MSSHQISLVFPYKDPRQGPIRYISFIPKDLRCDFAPSNAPCCSFHPTNRKDNGKIIQSHGGLEHAS